MKKLLSVSIMAMLAVSPMMANADPVSNTYGPAHSDTANSATAASPFASETITTEDQAGIASAAYVKGAYNAAIRAVNKVAEKANSGQTAQEVAAAVTAGINAAGGAGIAAANGKVSVDLATSNSGLAFDSEGDAGKLKVAITTSNVTSAALATGDQSGADNTKLATKGYADKVSAAAQSAAATYTDNAITALDLANTYDAKGAAATAEQNAKDYADGLASNYDAAGAAAGVQTAIEGKLDDGVDGYDVDFKTAKIQGTSIATKADVNNAINGSSVSTTGTIALYNAWGATTKTNVDISTRGTVSKDAYTEPQG